MARRERWLGRSTGGRALRVGVLLAMLGGILAVLPPLVSNAATTTPAVSPTKDPSHGFPRWYQDSTGTRLQPCLDPTDANCILAASASFDPAKPQVFPTNFPDEFFYNQAQSQTITTQGCKGAKAGGKLSVLESLEGAFVNGTPKFGDQMVFGRERIILTGGLCPKSTYTATTPYRSNIQFTTDANGALAKNQATTDVGCAPVAPNVCDFTLALNSPEAKSFLRWNTGAPAGYLGDGVTFHAITGGTNGNSFTVTGPGANGNQTLTTNLFSVMGKLAGPLASSTSPVDFSGQPVGATSAPITVTVSNLAPSAVAIPANAVSVTGTNAADFAVTGETCSGASLAQDTGTCQLTLTFKPGAQGARTATVQVKQNAGYGGPLSIPVTGTGTAGQIPGISLSVASIDFGSQRITYSTTSRDVVVTNSGTAPLNVTGATLSGTNNEFAVDSHCATPVAPGGNCLITVSFSPASVGAKTANLQISSNVAASPTLTVPLKGTGFGGRAAVSTDREIGGFPTWYQDEAGIRLSDCTDPKDPYCVVPAGTVPNPDAPLSFPDNYPDEAFYQVVDSDTVDTPGCLGTAPGKFLFRAGVEAAFPSLPMTVGGNQTFGRLRFKVSGGLCANTTYTAVTPYGTLQFTTADNGGIKPGAGTTDVGCAAPTAGGPLCDFSEALRSDVLGGFLRWDPTVAPKAPAGYAGDPLVLHTVVGAPSGSNSVTLYKGTSATGTPVLSTNKFLVMGKYAGPIVATPNGLTYDAVKVLDPAVSKTVTISNTGADQVKVNGTSVTGTGAASFTIGNNQCASTTLAPGASCNVEVKFAPTDQGPLKATLVVDHDGLNGPTNVPLAGTGMAPDGSAALSVDPATVPFAQLQVGRTSPSQLVTVSNVGGTAALRLGDLPITGAGAGSYKVDLGTCTADIAPDATCQLKVTFKPLSAGTQNAVLTVNAPVATAPSFRTVSLTGVGFAGDKAAATTVGADGFPSYYQDGNGVRVSPCLDPTDTNCAVPGGSVPDATQPVSFPNNYPNEFFYADAVSDKITAADTCSDGSTGGVDVQLQESVEGSFTTPAASAGNQITFGRSRIILGAHPKGGLCANSTYTFVTPYGEQSFDTDANGALKRNAATIDTGCGAAPCDFTSALNKPTSTTPGTPLDSQLDGLLRWDPNAGAAAPAGYLGDGVTFHKVVGGTYVPAGATEPVNYFQILKNGLEVGKTSMFTVVGKLAGGLAGGSAVDFGALSTNGTKTLPVTFTNIGNAAVAVASAAVTPTGSGFSVPAAAPCGGSIAAGGTCTVQVTFHPTVSGPASATVSLLAADGSKLASVPVSGSASTPATPQAGLSTTALTFGSVEVGTTPTTAAVTVTNTGSGTLTLATPTVTGTNAGDFSATPGSACSAGLSAGQSCSVSVSFNPQAAGNRTATLSLPSNAGGTVPTVALSGTGTGALISFKGSVAMGTQAIGRRTTKTFVITNAGTAPLRIPSVVVTSPTNTADFTAGPGTCATAVAPGKNCSISVTFAALAPAGAKSATITFPASNAANKADVQLPASGTSK